jgi:hypothetical protein
MGLGCFAELQKQKMQKMPDFKGQRDLFATKSELFARKTGGFFVPVPQHVAETLTNRAKLGSVSMPWAACVASATIRRETAAKGEVR